MNTRNSLYSVLILTLAPVTAAAAAPGDTAQEMIAAAGATGGLVIHVGCGDGALTAALRTGDAFLVEGLDRDPAAVTKARELFHENGILGAVSARRTDGKTLPYVDNLAALAVVENRYDIPAAEIMRVVRPGGAALFNRGGGTWKKKAKPRPAAIDDWTHYLHGPDNNPTAADTVVGPARRMHWKAGPAWCRSHEFLSSFAVMVSGGGRVFYIFDEGVSGITDPRLPERWALFARDAFSGVLLWKRKLDGWTSAKFGGKALRSTSPVVQRALVAADDRLFFTDGFRGPVAVLDAATGAPLRTVAGTAGTDEIVHAGGRLFIRVRAAAGKGFSGIVAADPKTGGIVWKHEEQRYLPMSMAAAGGKLVYHNRNRFVCLETRTGNTAWSATVPRVKNYRWSNGPTIMIARDRVLIGGGGGIDALDLATGTKAWSAKARGGSLRGSDLFVIGDLAWRAAGGGVAGFDLATGKLGKKADPKSVQSRGHHLRCYRAKATSRYIISQFRGVEFIGIAGDPHAQNDWTRGPCRYGVMPANGMLYVPPHPCFCYGGVMMKGLNAYDTAADEEMARIPPPAKTAGDRLEKGPAWGAVDAPAAPQEGDWPMYRRDHRRSGATPAAVGGNLKTRWKTSIGGRLTPPVAAGGTVYVAAVDGHTLYAFDIETGTQRWHYTAGGRIDSPPTLHEGLVLFGCADGRAYCLRAADGVLAWRFDAAPAARMIVCRDRVESAWRVHGSLLLRDETIYLTAGRSTFLDGGIFIYGLNPATGAIVCAARADTWSRTRTDAAGKPFLPAFHIEGARSDLLVAEGGFIYLGQMKFTPSLQPVDTAYRPGPDRFKEDRGGTNAYGPIVSGAPREKNPDYPFVHGDTVKKYPQLAKRWYRRGHMGARQTGRHLMSNSGFLDDTYFNRNFWMHGETWPGFYMANVAAKAGQILVIGPKRTYGVQAYPERVVLSPMFTPGREGYLLFADDNDSEPVLDEKDWGRDKGMGFSRSTPPAWSHWVNVRIRALTLAGDTLFAAGPPDTVDPKDPMASFAGRKGALLRAYAADSGKRRAEYSLEKPPVFDGMIAAGGHLLIAGTDGGLVCLGGE